MAPVLCHTRGARGQLLRTGACPFVLHQQLIASSIGGGGAAAVFAIVLACRRLRTRSWT